MRVLCCLDGANAEVLARAVQTMLRSEALRIGLLYVTDTRPHGELERQRERFLRPPRLPPLRQEELRRAEQETADDILREGERFFDGLPTELLRREGRAEEQILACAGEWRAELIVLCARSSLLGSVPHPPHRPHPLQGPGSVGHVARFVLDHASCPVLLIRGQL
jgi:nucleotide-binding universal stress UspA family protein